MKHAKRLTALETASATIPAWPPPAFITALNRIYGDGQPDAGAPMTWANVEAALNRFYGDCNEA